MVVVLARHESSERVFLDHLNNLLASLLKHMGVRACVGFVHHLNRLSYVCACLVVDVDRLVSVVGDERVVYLQSATRVGGME